MKEDHPFKDVSVRHESSLRMLHHRMRNLCEPISPDLGEDFETNIEKTDRSELLYSHSIRFLRKQCDCSKIQCTCFRSLHLISSKTGGIYFFKIFHFQNRQFALLPSFCHFPEERYLSSGHIWSIANFLFDSHRFPLQIVRRVLHFCKARRIKVYLPSAAPSAFLALFRIT